MREKTEKSIRESNFLREKKNKNNAKKGFHALLVFTGKKTPSPREWTDFSYRESEHEPAISNSGRGERVNMGKGKYR